MTDISNLVVRVNTTEVQKATDNFNNMNKSVGVVDKSLLSLNNVIAGFSIYQLTSQLIKNADAWTTLNNRLKLSTTSSKEFTEAQKELINVAQRTSTSLESTVGLYSKLSVSTQSLNIGQDRLLKVTETINKAAILSGASAEAADAAITQLGQGLASGTLRGDELNSVLEQTPRLAKAIAEGMGISVGELRKVAAEGKITSQSIINSIENQAKVVNNEFSSMAVTFEQAQVKANNALLVTIGTINEAINLNGELAKVLNDSSESVTNNQTKIADYSIVAKAIISQSIDILNLFYETVENTVQSVVGGVNSIVYGSLSTITRMLLATTEGLNAIGLSSDETLAEMQSLQKRMADNAQGSRNLVVDSLREISEAYKKAATPLSERIEQQKYENALAKLKFDYEKSNSAQTTTTTKAIENQTKVVKEKNKEEQKSIEISMMSSQAWQEYYETIGDYSSGWLIQQADLMAKYSDLTKEELDKLLAVAKEEYFDKFKKEAKDSFDFNIDLDGLDTPVSKMLSTMNKVNEAQEKYNKYIKQSGLTKEQIAEADDKNLSNQIKGYSNLSGAIAGMFQDGSKEAASFQIAQTTLAMLEGTRAILTAGTGDPYTAIPRMIAMGAMVSSLLGNIGIAFGMGGNSTSSDAFSAQTANTGTGSSLGDSKKQSESIVNAMGVLEEFAKPQYQTLQSMDKYLANISNNIMGLTSILFRNEEFALGGGYQGFDTGFKNNLSIGSSAFLLNPINDLISKIPVIGQINGLFGGITNSALGGLFGKTSVSQSMKDSGVFFADQLLKDAIDSFNGSAYQTIATTVTKKSWFSKSSSTSINSYFSALDSETNRQFSLVLENIYDTVLLSGDALDTSSKQLQNSLNNFVVSIGKVSLKDKTGTEIQETLTNVFGKVSDDLAKSIFPDLTPFQQVGEGMFETMTRVATGMEEAEFYIERLGKGFTDVIYTDIINKQGDIGFEALLQSIVKADEKAYGFSNNLVDIITNLNGTTEELYGTYVALDTLRSTLSFLNLDIDAVSYSSIRGAGSIDALSSGINAYIENFLTEQEKLSYRTTLLQKEFEKLNISMPTSEQGFRTLINGIDKSTEAGQQLFGSLIILSDSFSDVFGSISEIENQRLSLTDEYNLLKGTITQRQIELRSIDKTNIALQEAIWAEEDRQTALEKTKDSLNSVLNTITGNISTVENTIKSLSSTIDNLRGSSTNDAYTLKQFYDAMNSALSLSKTKKYDELQNAVNDVINYSSALNSTNFANPKELAYAQSVAANQLEGINLKSENQLTYLKGIENNTRKQIELLGGTTTVSTIPAFANGGIVTSPTVGLIGEAGYNEAIIPLDGRDNFGIGILVKTVNEQSAIIRQQNAILNTHSAYLKDTRDLTNNNYIKLTEIEERT